MKIKPEHYQHMRNAIAVVLPIIPTAAQYAERGIGKDPAMRHRWDAMYAARLSQWTSDTLYKYCNDTHIDTALRAIVLELTPKETEQSPCIK